MGEVSCTLTDMNERLLTKTRFEIEGEVKFETGLVPLVDLAPVAIATTT